MKNLLVLDLDETLVFGTRKRLGREADFLAGDTYYIYKRPHLDEFLKYCWVEFQVAVWTSSSPTYAETVVENIFIGSERPLFLWARDRCTRRFDPETGDFYWVKNLKKLKRKGYRLSSILMIDDSPEKLEKNYGNHVRVSPYLGANEDDELLLLIRYLEMIGDCVNFRSLEKRDWKARIQRDGCGECKGL